MTVAGDPITAPAVAPALPAPRGPLSEAVIAALGGSPKPVTLPAFNGVDALVDHDFQLALYCCYELHYRSFRGVDSEWEWWPPLLGARRTLEHQLEQRLFEEVGPPASLSGDVRSALRDAMTAPGGPSLSSYMAEQGTIEEMRELCIHRSAYQLKEADPHTWAIPRLQGAAKAAMVLIQSDEYGAGVESAMHANLFGDTMAALGLDRTYGEYLDMLPGVTLATVNMVSMFGLHRRWRGALVGHLALFELTSVTPMSRYSRGLDRLGLGGVARRFYDVHVAVDAMHEVVALEEMAAGLVADEPDLAGDVVFGAKAVMTVEALFAQSLLGAWAAGRSSLLPLTMVGPTRPRTLQPLPSS